MSFSETFRNKRVLITGATGFIGSRLIQQLLPRGAKIHALTPRASNLNRIENVKSRIALHKADITDCGRVKKLIRSLKPQIIYHLAGYGTRAEHADLKKMAEVNIMGLVNLLEGLESVPFECFVNSGSSAEYGPKYAPMQESQILEPNTYYGATKAAGDLLLQAFGKLRPKKVLTFRLFYVYGPGEELVRFIPTVVQTCLDGRTLKLTSRKEKKDFVFIDDVIDAYLMAPRSKINGPNIINIGTSVESTLGKVIKTVEHYVGKKLKVIEGAYQNRSWDSDCWAADIRKARDILGWQPTHNLETGLRKTIDWISSCCPQAGSIR